MAELFVEFSETGRRVSDLLNRIRQIKRRESKEEALKAIEEAKSKLEKSRDDLKACLSRVGILTKLKREDWYRWIGRWIDVLNSTIRDLEVHASDIRKEIGVVGEEKKEERSVEESEERALLEDWRSAIEGYWRILNRIRSFHIDGNILNLSSHQDWRNFCEALTNLERTKREVHRLVREMREGLHQVDNLERLRNLFRDRFIPRNILPNLLRSLERLEEIYETTIRLRENLEGKVNELLLNVSEDMRESYKNVLLRLITQDYPLILNSYRELMEHRRSESGNLEALRNKTIRVLRISF